MPVYTVHAPPDGANTGINDQFVFVRDGFHFWAMIFGPLWLLWHRLWLGLLGWVIFIGALRIGLTGLGVSRIWILLADIIVAVLMGLEAASLRRWALSRGKWRQLDIVIADSEDTAEYRFFERWRRKQGGIADHEGTVDRGGPPSQSFSNPDGIVGLFPEPGGTR